MLHIEKGAAQEAAVRFAEPEADPQTGFPIGRDHTDKSRNPHPEQGAGASGSKCSSNTGNISCSNGSSQGRAYRLELADGFRGIFIWRPFVCRVVFFTPDDASGGGIPPEGKSPELKKTAFYREK